MIGENLIDSHDLIVVENRSRLPVADDPIGVPVDLDDEIINLIEPSPLHA